jgi:hypothetical protein
VLKYPKRNIALRHGAQVIKRHDGEPKPEPPRDPNLKSWSAHLIGGKKMQSPGVIEAVSETPRSRGRPCCSSCHLHLNRSLPHSRTARRGDSSSATNGPRKGS